MPDVRVLWSVERRLGLEYACGIAHQFGKLEARNVAIANDGAISFERVVRATTLLHPRGQGIIEAPVTWYGTYGRPIHRQQRSLGAERAHVNLKLAS